MSLTAEHKKALKEGRLRAERERKRAAVARVRTFRKWLGQSAAAQAKGRKAPPIPEVPTDADYKTWRANGGRT